MKSTKQIVVYGAAGYTGQRVAQELQRRGHMPILAGREQHALEAVAETLGEEVVVREVHINDPQSLRTLLTGQAVVINCAGPFGVTAEPLAAAAIEAGVHYLDIAAAEQQSIQTLLHCYNVLARRSSVAVIPAMGFFGALGDMLAHLVGGPLAPLDELKIAYAIDGWLFTPGSRRTQERIRGERLVYQNGQITPYSGPPRFFPFSFPAPIGSVMVMEGYPLGETLTIPHHLVTRNITALMAASTIQAITEPGMPHPQAVTPQVRSQSRFTIAIQAVAGKQEQYGVARGDDIYGITAPIAAEAALRLITPGVSRTGALTPSEAFEPVSFLKTLQSWGFSYELSVRPGTPFS